MLTPTYDTSPKGTARVVAAMALLFLGAVAVAIPAAPIEVKVKERRGYMDSFARLGDEMAFYLSRDGYSFLALDLSTADPSATALWREQKKRVDQRRFPVWGWADASAPLDRTRALVLELKLDGLFVYGADPGPVATLARIWKEGFEVIEVRPESAKAVGGAGAVAMSLETFKASFTDPRSAYRHVPMKVLLADSLTRAQIDDARAVAAGDYLVVRR